MEYVQKREVCRLLHTHLKNDDIKDFAELDKLIIDILKEKYENLDETYIRFLIQDNFKYYPSAKNKKLAKILNFPKPDIIIGYLSDKFRFKRNLLFDETLSKEQRLKLLKQKVKFLRKIKRPEQRSKEWFAERERMITASSGSSALGTMHYPGSTREDYLLKKCHYQDKFTGNKYTQWGVKYEQIATLFYEHFFEQTVIEFGLIPHPEISYIGASPDGITLLGVMLEIKCPFTRKFIIDGIAQIPDYYWVQMQLQLEVCDLEVCDFLQCGIKEYKNEEEYKEDQHPENYYMTKDNKMKGVVLQYYKKNYTNEWDMFDYKYPSSLVLDETKLNKWINKEKKNKAFDKISYWKLNLWSNTHVERDRNWFLESLPKFKAFWDDVLYHRKHGIQDILEKRKEKENKKLEKKLEKIARCRLESDSESE